MRKFISFFLFVSLLHGLAFAQEPIEIKLPKELEPKEGTATVFFDHVPIAAATGSEAGIPNQATGEVMPEIKTINDPLEPLNRATFFVNDKIYRYGISPIGRVYEFVFPGFVRDRFSNIVDTLAFPKYFFSALFQGKFKRSMDETNRFFINATLGVGGMFDVAAKFDIDPRHEDFGQTFATHGMGNGFYLVLPLFGPSSGRDALGLVLDTATDGSTYIAFIDEGAVRAADAVVNFNDQLISVREYEEQTGQQFDPYKLVRDFYFNYREARILE